jgi:hypothetical protein
MHDHDPLQEFWNRACQIVQDAHRPPPKSKLPPPSRHDWAAFELSRIRQVPQRQIARTLGMSQAAVSRACRRVEHWLGTAAASDLREPPAEEKFRAAIRIHQRRIRYAQRMLLRDYRQSAAPQQTEQTRIRRESSQGKELERWEVTTKRSKGRDPKYLERYLKLSREEMALAGRCFPERMHRDRPFPREQDAQRLQEAMRQCRELLDEVRLLHEEYVRRLAAHQRIYGYMDEHALQRDHAPSIPLGGWVPPDDLSARRDQPGVFTVDEQGREITAESVYGPPEQWQPGTREWFERLRAADQNPAGGGEACDATAGQNPDGCGGACDATAGQEPDAVIHQAESTRSVASQASAGKPDAVIHQAESTGRADSAWNRKKPRKNRSESHRGPTAPSESKAESNPESDAQSTSPWDGGECDSKADATGPPAEADPNGTWNFQWPS